MQHPKARFWGAIFFEGEQREMVKRIVKLVTGLILTAAISVGMFILGDNMNFFQYEDPSETFVGVLSERAYGSKVETAKEFITIELTGATSKPIYSGYEKIADLSSEDIEKLALSAEDKAKVTAAERVVVHYTCDDVNRSMDACLLEMEGEYRYYVSPSSNGEALTNSYFDTVLDGARYLNCTSVTTVNMRLVNPQATTDATYRQTILFDDDKAFFDQELPGFSSDMYFVEKNEYLTAYLEHPQKNDGKFYSLSEINSDLRSQNLIYEVFLVKGGERVSLKSLSTLQDITDFAFMMQVDASYFVKTPNGFSMPNEKFKEVCKLMLGDLAYGEIEQAWDEYHIHFNSDYYVTNGRLSASKTVLTMSNGEDVFALTISVNYTDFGATEIVLPCATEE